MSNASDKHSSSALRFVDFAVRAWREGSYVQVIAHATPAGAMRHPVAVRTGTFSSDDFRLPLEASLAEAARLGRDLARLVLPREVWALLSESMILVAPKKSLGLRLRLCLDEDLIDLPWEYLYSPDADAQASLNGFLLIDDRISLVREPASVTGVPWPSDRTQRGLFVGAFFDDETDKWSVTTEHASLVKALEGQERLITMEFARADEITKVENLLEAGCDLFHYAGHIEVEEGRGSLVHLADSARFSHDPAHYQIVEAGEGGSWTWSDDLARMLSRRGTRIAVFNACNSGLWPFVRPFMSAGLPALIGIQGLVGNLAALNFAEKLYQSLAVGLSLDEALTYARLYVTDPARSYYDSDWGRFMAYMPTDASVLFPRPESTAMGRAQGGVRAERARTVRKTQERARELDGSGVSQMLSEIAARSVLILGRFTDDRKRILEGIKAALSTRPRPYVPILFDFDKPSDRDLIESVVRFAAVSRFVVADLSDPKSVPAELQAIVPNFPSLPVSLVIEESQREYPVSDNILRRGTIVGKRVVRYRDLDHLLSILDRQVLAPAEALYTELTQG